MIKKGPLDRDPVKVPGDSVNEDLISDNPETLDILDMMSTGRKQAKSLRKEKMRN